MVKRLNIDELDKKTQAFLKSIQIDNEQYLLESNGKPVLGIISPEEVERSERFKVFDQVWIKNNEANEEEVREDISEALKAVSGRTI